MANELDRAIRKTRIYERTKRRLVQRLDDVDWELDFLLPKLQELKETASSNLELPEFIIEEEEEDED